jgi:tetratricopeptide (TPR) repeat protein/tRNA A-37 threonylcarbamoyl transferase component Bud32
MTGPDQSPTNSTAPQRTLTEPTLSPRGNEASAVAPSAALPYELLDKLGQGGMGVVYKARQPGLNRIVAIKRLLPDAGVPARARFTIEAQAVAQVQHPNIVQIYEIGEADGLPYFSMEYVPGANLAAKLAGTPQDPGLAAQLVEVVARAVQAAHEHGIIHRDLKPSNILLSNDGTPKVSDFGLAKRLDDESGQTKTGDVFGTPSYMAPEQAAGLTKEVGPLADVYALGAILYELLTGRAPFKGASILDTLEQVRTVEPVAPRALQPPVPRDLETICLKCLQKEAARRYGSAQKLADDLRRFANGEPIHARPVGGGERLWRWCRRNPTVASLISAVALLLVLTAVVSLAALVRVNAARQAADRDADHARRALALANRTLDAAVNKITENPKLRDRGFFELRKDLLGDVLPHYAELAALQTDEPRLEAERARAFGKMGTIHMAHGDSEQAVREYREMESVFTSLLERHPGEPAYRYAAAVSQNDLAALLAQHGALEEARGALERGDHLAEPLVRDHPEVADHHLVRIRLRLARAGLVDGEGHHEATLAALREAGEWEADAESRFPGQTEFRALLGQILTRRGTCYFEMGQFTEAEQSQRQALDVIRPLGEGPSATLEQKERLAVAGLLLGNALNAQKRYREARTAKQEAVAQFESLCREAPNVPGLQEQQAKAQTNLAATLEELGQANEAADLRRRAVDTFEKLAAGFPANSDFRENIGLFYSVVGAAEYQHGRYGSALEWFTRATTYLEPIFHDGPHTALLRTKLAEAHAGSGGSLFGLKRYAEAIAELDRAQALDADKARMQVDTLRRLAIVLIQQEMVPALSLARAGDHVKATALAMTFAKGPNAHPEMDYNAACVFAICVGKVKDRDSVAAAGYATQALELLRHAQAGGLFKDAKRMGQLEKDHDLDPLRERAEFKKVIEEAKTKPGVSRP